MRHVVRAVVCISWINRGLHSLFNCLYIRVCLYEPGCHHLHESCLKKTSAPFETDPSTPCSSVTRFSAGETWHQWRYSNLHQLGIWPLVVWVSVLLSTLFRPPSCKDLHTCLAFHSEQINWNQWNYAQCMDLSTFTNLCRIKPSDWKLEAGFLVLTYVVWHRCSVDICYSVIQAADMELFLNTKHLYLLK